MARRILILDTPGGGLAELREAFAAAGGCEGDVVTGRDELTRRLTAGLPYDLLLLEYCPKAGPGGPEVLREVRAEHPDLPVVAVADRGDVGLAAEAVRDGATDYLVRGGRLSERVATQQND